MQEKIAIQGFEGSFHQIAAQRYFGKKVNIVCCANFRDLVNIASIKKKSAGGVMAIENSIAGSILPNYGLLAKSKLKIVGEVYLQIKQHLLVNPGVKIKDIKEVHSHPMALLQCIDYLSKHKWKLIESDDTAWYAKYIHQHASRHIAAVASKLAAEIYNLDIIASNIHNFKNNCTRFLILQREDVVSNVENVNKASINFYLSPSKGSLAKVLSKIADGGINISKLQSIPIQNSNWEYSFHADLEFEKLQQFENVIKAIKPLTTDVRIYGIYKKGKNYKE